MVNYGLGGKGSGREEMGMEWRGGVAIGKGRGKGQRRRAKGQAWQGVGWDVKKNIMVCVVGLRERQDAGEFGVWCLCCEFTYTDFGQLMFVGNSSLKKVSSTS